MTPVEAMNAVLNEYQKAREKFPPMNSQHEGYAVILEELEELWTDVMNNNPSAAKIEARQVAAMALAFMVET